MTDMHVCVCAGLAGLHATQHLLYVGEAGNEKSL